MYKWDQDLEQYQKLCRFIRRGTYSDIQKALVDRKPMFIEGSHIDPHLYVKKVERSEEAKVDKFEIITDITSIYATKDEQAMMTEQERILIDQFNEIDQTNAIIIPIMILVSEKNHERMLKSSEDYYYNTKEEFAAKLRYVIYLSYV